MQNNGIATGNIDRLRNLGIEVNGVTSNNPTDRLNKILSEWKTTGDMYLLEVLGHVYGTDRVYIDNLIKAGKETQPKNTIIAVEKDRTVIMLSQPHKTAKQLGISVKEYIDKGFKVYTT